MLDKETIKQIALANGFKLKGQANGEMDLNPYVYEFANAIAKHCWSAFKSGVMPHKIHPTKASLNNGWISVDDDNPTTDDFVFVLLLGKFPALGKYINNVWYAQALGSSYVNDMDGHRVTHWQPLSPLPEE